MPVRKTALLALFGLVPLLVHAHTHLQKSTPAADGAGADRDADLGGLGNRRHAYAVVAMS
jgi:hypothetical protein